MRIPATIAMAAALAGCLDYEDDIVQFEADFEECGLCDWSLTGSVEIVTTNHPAEHAALLHAASMSTPLGIVRDGADPYGYDSEFTDGNWLEYSTDCQGRPILRLDQVTADTFDVSIQLRQPVADDFRRSRLMFPPLAGDPSGPITFRRLAVVANGDCRVDNLRIMVSGGTLGY